jgi:hypothetical protein
METKYPILFSACLFLLPGCRTSGQKQPEKQKSNVLFICVDDLRRDLGCYGSVVKSPNIDKLAGQGSLFFNHYTLVPTSGASRAGMLTGRYPREKSDLSNEACRTRLSGKPETEQPETMFHHLKRNGYYTVGIGKISHYVDGLLYGYTDPAGVSYELPYSWDELLETERMLKKHLPDITLKRAQELVKTMYQLTYRLPNSKKIHTKVLGMSYEQRRLYEAVEIWCR